MPHRPVVADAVARPSPAVTVAREPRKGSDVSAAAPVIEPDVTSDTSTEEDRPYNLFLWNDDTNDMAAVAYIIQKILGVDEDTALALMLTAHHEGKAVVWTGERDQAVAYAEKFHAYGLQATVAKDA